MSSHSRMPLAAVLAVIVWVLCVAPASAEITGLPSFVEFPDVQGGQTSAPVVVTFTNNGSTPVSELPEIGTVDGIDDGSEFQIRGGTCFFPELAPLATCEVSVVFAPPFGGDYLAALNFGDGSVTLKGRGLGSVLRASPAGVDFGRQEIGAASETQTVGLTVLGRDSVQMTGASLPDDATNQYEIVGDGCHIAFV